MTISWFGLSSFKIQGKDITIITDPFGSTTGLSAVRGAADIVICSNPENQLANNFSSIQNNPFIIQGPGEYEVKGVFVMGTSAEQSTIYAIEIEGIRIAFMGQVKQKTLSDLQIEVLESSDVVLVPIGNTDVTNFEDAAQIAAQLEPKYVIPHTYAIPGLKLNLDKPEKFIKEMGGEQLSDSKLQLKSKDLAFEATKLMILTPQR